MNRNKRRAPASFDFEWQTAPSDDVEAPLPDVRFKHTQIHLSESGTSSRRTTFIPTPASPVKRTLSSTQQYDYDYDFDFAEAPALCDQASLSNTFDDDLDPAYLHHHNAVDFNLIDLNERRKRPPQASKFEFVHCFRLIF